MAMSKRDADQVIKVAFDEATDSLRVSSSGSSGETGDISGTTSATPGQASELAAANTSRKYLVIQNLDSTNYLFINFGDDAAINTPGSFKISPLGSFTFEMNFIVTQAISVCSNGASVKFTAKEA